MLKPHLQEDRTYPFLSLSCSDATASAILSTLRILREQAPHLNEADAAMMISCIAGLTASVLNRLQRSTEDFNSQNMHLARQFQALDIIRHRFYEPDFSSSDLACQLGLSRSTVYRLLEPVGGFHNCIREQRMRHAIRLLRKSGTTPVSVHG